MKNFLIQYFFLVAVTVACREDAPFLERPNIRIEKLLTAYKQKLTDSENGWNGFLFPGEGGGFSFYLKFSPEGRVIMLSDISRDCATKIAESSYTVTTYLRPALVFDTYSYIHLLSDPHPDTLGGIPGKGFTSDFEFAFEKSTGDTIRLKGNQNGSEFILVRATSDESKSYLSGELDVTMTSFIASLPGNNFYPYFPLGNQQKASVNIDTKRKEISILSQTGLFSKQEKSVFAFTPYGLFLQKPLSLGNRTFRKMLFIKDLQRITAVTNEDNVEMMISSSPVLPLHVLLGGTYSAISAAPRSDLNAWSDAFVQDWNFFDFGIYECCNLLIDNMDVVFDDKRKSMGINIYTTDAQAGGKYVLRYYYSYLKSSNGVYNFVTSDDPNPNGKLLEPAFRPILDHLEKDRFVIAFINSSEGYRGQIRSLEFPDFYFSGSLN